MTSPVVVPAPELSARFDPRTGTTGNWLGADSARSVPLNDAAGRTLWLFADTYWADGDTTPGTRSGSYITSDSLAVQTGPDLATATLTFHQATTPTLKWFPVTGTHSAWPMDAVVIGDDLYVTSTRFQTSNPLGAEYGWTVHKVPNARTSQVTDWASTLLYESANTGTRPLWSPYVDGGYVYAFAIRRPVGWLWCRWTLADFTGAGTQGAVQWYTGAAWSAVEADAMVISANPATAEGSVHRRAVDGRWTITDSGGEFPLFHGEVRQAVDKDVDGNYVAAGVGGYAPVGRNLYENPRHDETPLPPDYWTYAHKAHPSLPGSGLVLSYVDNGVLAAPLDIYWPKFVRVLAPTVAGLAVNADGLVSWSLNGGPDRVRIRVAGGAWTELTATTVSHQLDGYVPGQSVEVQAIGIGGASGRIVNGTIDEAPGDQPPKPPSVVDWLIWPRDPDLSRGHDPLSGWTQLVLVERDNKPDTWVITGPPSALGVFGPGMGAVLDRDGEQVTSGQVTSIRRWSEGGVESMEVAFASDLSIFRLARPEQGTTMVPNQPRRFAASHDTYTGAREDAILHYLRASVGTSALPDRRIPRLRFPTSLGRGGHTSTSARFDELGPLVQSLGEAANLRVTIVHTEDVGGSWLDVRVTEAADLSADVRFGTSESTAAGLITDYDYELATPTATRALVMGGGELQMRVGLEVRDTAAEELWGTVAEALVDQRQSDPLDDEARIGATAALIAEAQFLANRSLDSDIFLRQWVAGSTLGKTANLGWSWLVGWDFTRQFDLTPQQLGDIAKEIEATTADEHPLPDAVEAIRDTWQTARQSEDDIRRAMDDALNYAWDDPQNELGHAAAIIEATNLLDARMAAVQTLIGQLAGIAGQYGPASASHWAARVAAVVLELGDAGREVLAERAGPVSVTFTPTLGPDLEYRRDVNVSSRVGVDLPELPPMTDKIRQAETTVSVESGQATERVQVVVGTPDAPTTRTQQQTARALRSINQIQRSK